MDDHILSYPVKVNTENSYIITKSCYKRLMECATLINRLRRELKLPPEKYYALCEEILLGPKKNFYDIRTCGRDD